MLCEKCIYDEVCSLNHDVLGIKRVGINKCPRFKDESKFIELPYHVGQEIYFVDEGDEDMTPYYHSGKIESINIQRIGICCFARYDSGLSYWHFSMEDTYFTKDQAEARIKAIVARKKNG